MLKSPDYYEETEQANKDYDVGCIGCGHLNDSDLVFVSFKVSYAKGKVK